jgi:hypothetical protein
MRLAARIASPAARLLRWRLAGYRPVTARVEVEPEPDRLAEVFFRSMKSDMPTTFRDADYLRWRFLAAPYRSELTFYTAGPQQSPSHILISRTTNSQWGKSTSFLDVFGDFSDREGLADIVRTALRDAVGSGSTQVLILSTVPQLSRVLRSSGFLISGKVRFCWNSTLPDIMRALGEQVCHWSLADSDNDEPV